MCAKVYGKLVPTNRKPVLADNRVGHMLLDAHMSEMDFTDPKAVENKVNLGDGGPPKGGRDGPNEIDPVATPAEHFFILG